ncbi:PorV/PorQ family protein [candidate division KSB1 bacterium]|nr:PorV/PorQ family protein [candidate division KSB1 bacterium]
MYFHGLCNSNSRMIVHPIILLLFLATGLTSTFASGFQSLESGVDSRSASMGFTGVAMQDDPIAGFGNPAAILQGPIRSASFSMNNWIQDMQSGSASLVISKEKSALGLSMYYSEIGEIEHRLGPSENPIGTFSSHDFIMGLSYARMIVPGVSAGVTLRSYYQKIYMDDAWGVGGDLGVMWSLPDRKTRFGGVIQHIGKSGALIEEDIELPTTARIGVSRLFSFQKIQGQVQIDAVKERDAPFHLHAGLELGWAELLYLRTGVLSGYETRDFTFGLGFRIQQYGIDYAIVPFKSGLGDVHLLSVLFKW